MNKYDKLLAVAKHINKYWSAGHHFTAFGHLQNKLYEAIQECEEDKQLPDRFAVIIENEEQFNALGGLSLFSHGYNASYPYYFYEEGRIKSRDHMLNDEDLKHPIYTFSEWQSMQKGGENGKSSHVSVAHDGVDYKTPVLVNGTDSVEIKTPEISKREYFASQFIAARMTVIYRSSPK